VVVYMRCSSETKDIMFLIPPLRLTSRKPLWRESEPVDINSQWRESWKSASVVNAHLVDDPTIRQPGFALPRQQWSLLSRLCTGQGHCGACKKKWKLSDSNQCSCGETQTMSHIVKSFPQTRLHGGLSKLHSAADDAVAWLTSYGSCIRQQQQQYHVLLLLWRLLRQLSNKLIKPCTHYLAESRHIHRAYAVSSQMSRSMGTVQHHTAMHGLLRAIVAKEREIMNSIV